MGCLDCFKKRAKNAPSGATPAQSSGGATTATTASKSSTSTASPWSQRSISSLYEERGRGQLRAFAYEELRGATGDFARAHKLGEGGFGSVYRGAVRALDGKQGTVAVAVKRLNTLGFQGHKQWLAEVQFLAVLEHPNLVNLIGYCGVDGERGAQRLLVYEYMPNKSLEDYLFSRANAPLSWNRRLQIILGAAEGLAYLHEGLEVQVIYRDFKASNVLLDKDFRPKLSDFGLAREGPTDGNTHVSTAVVGTQGYAAPDYIETGHLTVKSDVWSFGVVLYEILTGRRSLDRSRPAGQQRLLDWVGQFPPDCRNFRMVVDPRLRGEYSVKAAREVARLAESCLVKNPKERPAMTGVVQALRRTSAGGGSDMGRRVETAPLRR